MPEVVDEGVTGYLAHDIESSVDAVRAAVRLDRSAVHARAVARFGADRMVDDYLRTYEALLKSASTDPRMAASVSDSLPTRKVNSAGAG